MALCWGNDNIGHQNPSGIVNSWYYYDVYPNVNYPQNVTFATAPLVIGNVSSNNLTYGQRIEGSTSKITHIAFGSPQSTVTSVNFSWIAIGRLA